MKLEAIEAGNWQEFTRAPLAVLMLGKSDCEACAAWSEELQRFLEEDEEFADVRFGKVLLDRPGLVGFKKANPWLAEVDALPYNVIFASGERVAEFAGGGAERLARRLRRLRDEAAS